MGGDFGSEEGLESLPRDASEEGLESLGSPGKWEEPFDLRVMRPRAVDLRKLWGLGYEFVADDGLDANTMSVMPDNQVLEVARVGQSVNLGPQLGEGSVFPKRIWPSMGWGRCCP